jgi:hypothetical protein
MRYLQPFPLTNCRSYQIDAVSKEVDDLLKSMTHAATTMETQSQQNNCDGGA